MLLNKKAWKKIALTAILLLVTALAAYFYLLPGIASFLIVETNLQHSDVIIILGGDRERVPYGVKLYMANYSDKIIVTGGMLNIPHINTTWAELEKEEAIDMGVRRTTFSLWIIVILLTKMRNFQERSCCKIIFPQQSW